MHKIYFLINYSITSNLKLCLFYIYILVKSIITLNIFAPKMILHNIKWKFPNLYRFENFVIEKMILIFRM